MERITSDTDLCATCDVYLDCLGNYYCPQRTLWERLKAYEDTGFSPDEVKAMQKQLEELAENYENVRTDVCNELCPYSVTTNGDTPCWYVSEYGSCPLDGLKQPDFG